MIERERERDIEVVRWAADVACDMPYTLYVHWSVMGILVKSKK